MLKESALKSLDFLTERASTEARRRHTAAMLGTSSIVEAVRNPDLFAPHFDQRGSWHTWYVFLKSLFGLELEPGELAFFKECTGRDAPPTMRAREAWLIVGRRGGKSFVLALIAVFLACFVKWDFRLAPGERPTIMVIAADKDQARIIFSYAAGLIHATPVLAELIKRESTNTISLTNGIHIEIRTASFRSVRGYTIPAALCDEIAFWPTDDSANPDVEILNAIRPAMANVPGAMLLCASSPYARKGALWKAYRNFFGKDGDILVWQADTRKMNSTIPQEFIDQQYADDPVAAAAEYGALFRSDVEAFISQEVVDAVTQRGVKELPPRHGMIYTAFADPSGGSADSFTLAIGHAEDGKGVQDLLRERRPPFSPDDVCKEFADTLHRYGVFTLKGDKYAGEWVVERFRVHGITYEHSEKTKSELYVESLPILNAGRAQILDEPRQARQLCTLERRVARSGKESIDHPPGGHDDCANVLCGLLPQLVGDAAIIDTWTKLGSR